MIRLILAIGRYLSCSRTLEFERGLCSPLSWLPPPGLVGAPAAMLPAKTLSHNTGERLTS
uniref:Uncharacterized protein n=1 Tax=Rhizophora mucronata TaxID=61149 RepID=A0A2P2PY88_RHIMU